jgi:hypothetical protein
LPSIWIPPSGNSQSSARRYQSFIANVFGGLQILGEHVLSGFQPALAAQPGDVQQDAAADDPVVRAVDC